MDDARWRELIAHIEGEDTESMVEASEHLYKEADTTDTSKLLTLLLHDDFVVREAAAWPLAVVGGPDVLPDLLKAYQRGFDEGYDNDGLAAALIELVELQPKDSRRKLMELKDEGNQKHAEWLLGFC